eukprot:594433-Prorocentrum_minimum.AAC.1
MLMLRQVGPQLPATQPELREQARHNGRFLPHRQRQRIYRHVVEPSAHIKAPFNEQLYVQTVERGVAVKSDFMASAQ